jgi:hypothetical protein
MMDEVTEIEIGLKFQEYVRRRVIEILGMKVLQC